MPASIPTGSTGASLAPCRTCGRTFPAEVLVCPADGTHLALDGRLLDGKFHLDRKIGDGGMASVWQATNVRVERTVAIKLMHARFAADTELLARFRNEAAAAGKIDSDHICDVLDFGESPIGPFIVMELLEGCSLAELIQRHRRLDVGLAVWILRQALAGLAAAHRAGIVHRDLKPENIFLCKAIRGQWTVKLMDFGISKFAADPNTAAGATLGTPHYMAPEQIQGAARVDARADLWSCGVILYEAVTGVQLFAREGVANALAALRTFDPPPLTHHLPAAPRGLAEVVARCLVRAPDRRIASAEALAEALKPFEQPGARVRQAAEAAAGPRPVVAAARVAAAQPVPADRPAEPAGPRLPMPGSRWNGPQPPSGGMLPAPASMQSARPAKQAAPLAAKPVVAVQQAPAKQAAVVQQAPAKQAAPIVKQAALVVQPAPAKPAAVLVQPAPAKPAALPRGPTAKQAAPAAAPAPMPRDPTAKQGAPANQAAMPRGPTANQGAPAKPVAGKPPGVPQGGGNQPVRARQPAAPGPAMDRAVVWGLALALGGGLLVLLVVLATR